MRRSQRSGVLTGLAVAGAVALSATPALAWGNDGGGNRDRHREHRGDPIEVVAEGLEGPFGLSSIHGRLLVAEQGSGPGTGRITVVNPRSGSTRAVQEGLTNPAAVTEVDGRLAFVTSGAEVPDTTSVGDSTVFLTPRRWTGTPRAFADLKAYELENNPDGQLQFDPTTKAPLDSLSNPFDIVAQPGDSGRRYVMVADAGANDVLSLDSRGRIRTFFVPPVITTGACAGAPNNDPQHTGCDPVPTGLAYGPRNTLYVSTLTAEAPGEGRVYVLDARTGDVRRVITGLDAPTGIAVGDHGEIYVSEVIYGAPEGEGPPPPGFDPSSVGRIVRIDRHGTRSYASVPMPIGLEFHHGRLYSTAWSLAGMFGMPGKGQVVKVNPWAFQRSQPTTTTTTTPASTTTTMMGTTTTTAGPTTTMGPTTTTTTSPPTTTSTTSTTSSTTTTVVNT